MNNKDLHDFNENSYPTFGKITVFWNDGTNDDLLWTPDSYIDWELPIIPMFWKSFQKDEK